MRELAVSQKRIRHHALAGPLKVAYAGALVRFFGTPRAQGSSLKGTCEAVGPMCWTSNARMLTREGPWHVGGSDLDLSAIVRRSF